MKTVRVILMLAAAAAAAFIVTQLVSCETMTVRGSIGYVDPESGAKAGLTLGDEKSGWWIKIPVPAGATVNGAGVVVVEGAVPKVETKSGK